MRFGTRELLFMMVLLAVPCAAYFLVFQPTNVQIAEARTEIEEKTKTLQAMEEVRGESGRIDDDIQQLQTAIAEFNEQLPDADGMQDVLRQISEIASDRRLEIDSLRTEATVHNDHWSERELKLKIVGDFDSFYSFLSDLEQLQRIIKVTNMDLSTVTAGEREGAMQADVNLIIYFEGRNAG